MKWTIQGVNDGRYVRCHEPGTLLFSFSRNVAQVFEGTRDYVDGICNGLCMATGDQYIPVRIINTQTPADEKVDDIHERT